MILVYIYSFLAFMALGDSFIGIDGVTDTYGYCDTLIICFTTILNQGVRSHGGVGDILT